MDAHISGIENVGSRLRMVRLEKDHTQGELGDLAGTNQASIQKIENGKSIRPRMIMDLAEALGVNPAWLQFGEPFAVTKRPGLNGRASKPSAEPETVPPDGCGLPLSTDYSVEWCGSRHKHHVDAQMVGTVDGGAQQ